MFINVFENITLKSLIVMSVRNIADLALILLNLKQLAVLHSILSEIRIRFRFFKLNINLFS